MRRLFLYLLIVLVLAACAPSVSTDGSFTAPPGTAAHTIGPAPAPSSAQPSGSPSVSPSATATATASPAVSPPAPTATPAPFPSATPVPAHAPAPPPVSAASPSSAREPGEAYILFAIGGDVAMEYRPGVYMTNGAWEKVLDEAVVERFAAADAAMVNLETSVSYRGEPKPKTYTYRTAPENLLYLRDHLGVDVVSLANNHTLDYGVDAFTDTLDFLDEYALGRVGAGRTLAEAKLPYIIEAQGRSIAVFGASQTAPKMDWYASDTNPGHLMAYDTRQICAAVTAAKETNDFVIVYLHWGTERATEPKELQITSARKIIDAGADVVVGSHPHVIQTFEIYKERPILYSLGNFLFNTNEPVTAAAYIHLEDGRVRAEIEPLVFTNGTAMKAGEAKRDELLRLWADRSTGTKFDAEGFLIPEDS